LPAKPTVTAPSHADLARRLQGLNLYLVGMMGTGKSAVGAPLAEALGYRFIDADAVLEQASGRSIPDIFASDGETAFRELETAVLGQISGWHSLVVATGGGVVTRSENWGHMQQGVVVWLDAPAELLLQRLEADSTARPLMAAPDPRARLDALLEQRLPLYSQADLTISQNGEPPAAVAEQVLLALPSLIRARPSAPTQPVILQTEEGGFTPSLN
jgi:shikimate kinase